MSFAGPDDNEGEEEEDEEEEGGSSRTLHAKEEGDKDEVTRKRNPPSLFVLPPSNEMLPLLSSSPPLVVRSRYTCHFPRYQQCTRGAGVELSYTEFHANTHGPGTTVKLQVSADSISSPASKTSRATCCERRPLPAPPFSSCASSSSPSTSWQSAKEALSPVCPRTTKHVHNRPVVSLST